MAYDFLIHAEEESVQAQYMMVGYRLENTLTDNGYVSRGVCETDENGYLADINERTHIENVTAEQLTQRTMEKHGQHFLLMHRYP